MKHAFEGAELGKKGEDLAVRHLKKMGYKILERNYRNRIGEIDIIAKQKDTLVFVEVKSRRSDRFGNPKYALTPDKMRKISMVALGYLQSMRLTSVKARFDVVAIRLKQDHPDVKPDIELVQNAFELAFG